MRQLLEQVRRPAYTGDNRCTPCTVLNLLVAGVVSGALAAVSPGVAVLAFTASVAVVYLRGYLVPGTPAITARYFPAELLELFGKESVTADGDAVERADDAPLAACGAVERSGDGERRLTPTFRRAWNDRIRDVRGTDVDADDVATALGVDPDAVAGMGGGRYLVENERLVQWVSETALVADVAAGRELRTRGSDWDDRTVEERLSALAALRSLRRECPACGGPVSRTEETVESCCQPPTEVVSASCEDCGAELVDARLD